jgi:hypothetical protein
VGGGYAVDFLALMFFASSAMALEVYPGQVCYQHQSIHQIPFRRVSQQVFHRTNMAFKPASASL